MGTLAKRLLGLAGGLLLLCAVLMPSTVQAHRHGGWGGYYGGHGGWGGSYYPYYYSSYSYPYYYNNYYDGYYNNDGYSYYYYPRYYNNYRGWGWRW